MVDEYDAEPTMLSPDLPNLADAAARLGGIPGMTGQRLARVEWAVRTFARLLGKSANEIPAHPGFISRQIRRLRRRPSGLSPKSMANMKSELLFLVRSVYGPGRRSEFAPLSPAWIELRGSLGDNPDWWKLSRLARFASARGVTPADVDDQTISAFRTALVESGMEDTPELRVRAAIQAWNRTASRLGNLDLKYLTLMPQRRQRWTIDEKSFRPSSQEDVARWLTRLAAADPLAEDGPRRALRPDTLRLRRHQIYKAASALVFAGRPIDAIRSLACLVTDEAFVALMGVLLQRQGNKTSEALRGLAGALLALARHHVKLPKEQADRLSRRVARLAPEEVAGFREKTRKRLAPLEDDRLLGALLHLPQRLLQEAEVARSPRQATVRAQMAVAIEIELNMPLRLRNLLLQHVRRLVGDGRRLWLVEIPRGQTKNRHALCFELQPASVALIERALKFYEAKDGWLFPGRSGGHMVPTSLGNQVKRTIERRLGITFHVHLFRALSGQIKLSDDPAGFESVRALLGDKDDQVVRDHYTFVVERHLIADAQASIMRRRARLESDLPGLTKAKRRRVA